MKILMTCLLFLIACLKTQAEIVEIDPETFEISGCFTFWADRNLRAPTGTNDWGEIKSVVFKPNASAVPEVLDLKKTRATLKAKARVTSGILVVTEILGVTPESSSAVET